MLSYRHGYHAGNAADVLKHAVLAFCLDYLRRKPKPFLALDTHAGAGLYDLTGAVAQKTGEWRGGIGQIARAEDAPALVTPYLNLVRQLNAGRDDLRVYPGSPCIMAEGMRPGDRIALRDLHPSDHGRLFEDFAGVAGVAVERADGWQALVDHLPPRERRGLVLIDPSYEIKSDYETAPEKLVAAHRRFATGVYLLWYPVVDRVRSENMIARIAESGMRRIYRFELATAPDTGGRGMTASGVIAVNPPFTLPGAAEEGLAWLSSRLKAHDWRVDCLAGE